MRGLAYGRRLLRDVSKAIVIIAVLPAVFLTFRSGTVAAQHSDARSDGNAARFDAMFGTPDRCGTAPRDNIFATPTGLEQQESLLALHHQWLAADVLYLQR